MSYGSLAGHLIAYFLCGTMLVAGPEKVSLDYWIKAGDADALKGQERENAEEGLLSAFDASLLIYARAYELCRVEKYSRVFSFELKEKEKAELSLPTLRFDELYCTNDNPLELTKIINEGDIIRAFLAYKPFPEVHDKKDFRIDEELLSYFLSDKQRFEKAVIKAQLSLNKYRISLDINITKIILLLNQK